MAEMMSDKSLLVIEDEQPLLAAVKAKLESLDINVTTARSVKQAINYLEDGVTVDAIWLDHYLLGKESGLDFVARVKNPDSKWREIPVFLVSNTASADKIRAYMKLGVNKYYAKVDFRLDDIIKEIADYFSKQTKK